jgi:hypothetical protein
VIELLVILCEGKWNGQTSGLVATYLLNPDRGLSRKQFCHAGLSCFETMPGTLAKVTFMHAMHAHAGHSSI